MIREMDDSLLHVDDIDVFYRGGIQALWSVSFHLDEGEFVSLIGSNGAGKSTTIKTITGLLKPAKGRIYSSGRSIERLASHEIVEMGILQIPESRQLFPSMTVKDNLVLGSYPLRAREKRKRSREWVYSLFPILAGREHQMAGSMSGGEQQMLAIGRGLMANPKLLMIDELSLGLAPLLVKQLFQSIESINREGVTILLVEQNVKDALQISNRGMVMENGRIALKGKSEEILGNEYVQKAYLGL